MVLVLGLIIPHAFFFGAGSLLGLRLGLGIGLGLGLRSGLAGLHLVQHFKQSDGRFVLDIENE